MQADPEKPIPFSNGMSREGNRVDSFYVPHRGTNFNENFVTGTIYDRYTGKIPLSKEGKRTIYSQDELPSWFQNTDVSQGLYLQYLKRLRRVWPEMGFFAEWMDVSTTQVKLPHLKPEQQLERAKRTKVEVIDFEETSGDCKTTKFNNPRDLHEHFHGPQGAKHDNVHTRIVVVEDLSREVIEILGSRFDIDPFFFLGQLFDYTWYNNRDPWYEGQSLWAMSKDRPFTKLEYMQARYLPTQDSIKAADKELVEFNVLRRKDADGQNSKWDDPESDGALIRSKMSMWIRPNKGTEKGVLAILVVDPTIKAGFPLWNGYHDFTTVPKMSDIPGDRPPPDRKPPSTFEDMVKRISSLDKKQLAEIQEYPRELLRFPLMRVASDWHLVLQYAGLRLSQVTWELEDPPFLKQLNKASVTQGSTKKLNPWRRRLPYMKKIVTRVVQQTTDPKLDMAGDEGTKLTASNRKTKNSLADLHYDFSHLESQLEELIAQTDKILSFAVNMVSIEESRKAIEQNDNVARLTLVALVFVPLSFVASLFSMSPDMSSMKKTFWIYFVVAVPVSLIMLAIVKTQSLLGLRKDQKRKEDIKKVSEKGKLAGASGKWNEQRGRRRLLGLLGSRS